MNGRSKGKENTRARTNARVYGGRVYSEGYRRLHGVGIKGKVCRVWRCLRLINVNLIQRKCRCIHEAGNVRPTVTRSAPLSPHDERQSRVWMHSTLQQLCVFRDTSSFFSL